MKRHVLTYLDFLDSALVIRMAGTFRVNPAGRQQFHDLVQFIRFEGVRDVPVEPVRKRGALEQHLQVLAQVDDLRRGTNVYGKYEAVLDPRGGGLFGLGAPGSPAQKEDIAEGFFQLINIRDENGPVVMTSNRSFSKWVVPMSDEAIATAMLDLLLHHAHVFSIKADSYRMKDGLRVGAVGFD